MSTWGTMRLNAGEITNAVSQSYPKSPCSSWNGKGRGMWDPPVFHLQQATGQKSIFRIKCTTEFSGHQCNQWHQRFSVLSLTSVHQSSAFYNPPVCCADWAHGILEMSNACCHLGFAVRRLFWALHTVMEFIVSNLQVDHIRCCIIQLVCDG